MEIIFSHHERFESLSRPLNTNTVDYMNELVGDV